MSYPRLSSEQRRKLASSARAKEAGRNAALRIGVRGGAGPGQGAPIPDPASYEYQITPEQRAVIDRVMEESHSPDAVTASRALGAWEDALYRAAPHLPAVLALPAYAGGLILDFPGRRIFQPFTLPAGMVKYDNGNWSIVITGIAVGPLQQDGSALLTIDASHVLYAWTCVGQPTYNATLQKWLTRFSSNSFLIVGKSAAGDYLGSPFNATGGGDLYREGQLVGCPHPGYGGDDWSGATPPQPATWYKSSRNITGVVNNAAGGLRGCIDSGGVTRACTDVLYPDNSSYSLPALLAPSYHEEPPVAGAPAEEKLDKPTLEELLRILCEEYGYCPEDPCDPVGGGPGGGGPGGYDPPGYDPPGGGGPGGGGPGGGFDPFDPGEPGGYEDPGPGDGRGTFDPGRETCITFRDPPTGFNDPGAPGGIARRYQPGQRATVRSGGTDRAADAVERTETSADCWNALVAAGWSGRTNDGVERLYPPYDFIKRKDASDQLWNCLILLGWTLREQEEDVQVVNESALYRPGAPDVYTGKINRVKRLENGGVRICFKSPVEDKPAKEKICFRGKVQDAIASVLSQMGVENVIFDSDCNEVIFPRVCFPAGTPLRHILDYLLDLCGFCVFPQFDGNVIVGFCTPLNVHWHYHEDVDLIGFDLEYGNEGIPAIVEVFRPDKVNRAGRIIEQGYAYPYPVQSAVAASEDVLRIEVPFGTTDVQVRAIAHSRARSLANKSLPLTGFAVPMNSKLRLRHQIHINMPSRGFKGVYMVTRLARDYSDEAFLNLGMGRWLRGSGG